MDALAFKRQYRSAQVNGITVLLSSGQTSSVKSPPSGVVRAPAPGMAPGRSPMAQTVNNLVHGKGLASLNSVTSHHISFALGFSKEKEMEGKPLVGLLPYWQQYLL